MSRNRIRTSAAGNTVALLVDGDAVFGAMLDAVAAAERCVVLETYTFAADATGQRFRAALLAAQNRGVLVYVLVDGVGSMGTGATFFSPLKAAGAHVAVFHPLRMWGPLRLLWRRDHRKLLVIDGHTAFIGGLNIGDAHASVLQGGMGWHDMHARVQGPVAADLQALFAQTWRRAAAIQKSAAPPALPVADFCGPVTVYVLDGLYRRRRSIRGAYLQAVRKAQHSIRICSAYFIPDRAFIRALIAAQARGVAVEVLLAGVTDVAAVQWASRALYQRLLEAGITLYEWQAQVLHAKTMVCDGTWVCIGSYNMDRRSLLYNLEANIACQDATFGSALDAQFTADVQGSKRILPAAWHRRPVINKVCEQVFYWLRYWL